MDNISFLTWIANGFNPYTGEKLSDNDPLQTQAVKLRLKNFAEELSQDCTDERVLKRNSIEIVYPYTSIQPFAKSIAHAIYNALTFGKIQDKILNFLLDEKLLEYRYAYPESEKMSKFATNDGEKLGITNEIIITPYGKKQNMIYYSPTAQIYIINNLSEILKYKSEF